MIQQSVPVVSSDRRLADHFGGKLHLGYMLIREKLAELQVIFANHLLVQFLKFSCINTLPSFGYMMQMYI